MSAGRALWLVSLAAVLANASWFSATAAGSSRPRRSSPRPPTAGELLALRWRDVDLEAAIVSVRRSAGMVRVAGEGADVVEGGTRSGKPRVVDLDESAAAVLKAWKRDHGGLALQLVKPDALVFGDIEGAHRNPEHVSRQFVRDVDRFGQVPAIRLHDLRHTHATLLQFAGP
jgi:integrase